MLRVIRCHVGSISDDCASRPVAVSKLFGVAVSIAMADIEHPSELDVLQAWKESRLMRSTRGKADNTGTWRYRATKDERLKRQRRMDAERKD